MVQSTVATTTVVVLLCFPSLSTKFGVVCAGRIPPMASAQQQQLQHVQDSGIRVYVTPQRSTIHYGGTVTIRCRAKGGNTVADMPYIRFSMLFEPDTALPLNAGIPGVSIESEPVSSNYSLARYNFAVQKLSLGNEMYHYLQYGDNRFMCKAVNLNRDQQKQEFIITKV